MHGDMAMSRRFLFQTIHDGALMLDRERAGREASPTRCSSPLGRRRQR